MKTKVLIGMTLALSSAFSVNAIAGPLAIGLDLTGTGTFSGVNYVESTLWTDITDTGVSVGALANNAIHDFSGQVRVGTMTDNGSPVTPLGLNAAANSGAFFAAAGLVGPFEITKTYSFQDILLSLTGDPITGAGTAQFGMYPNAGPNLTIYFDPYNNTTDQSRAIPGSGAGTVSNYGDGTKILEATLISNTSSFTSTAAGVGNGSFDLGFEFTYINPLYVKGLAVGDKLQERFTGTLTQGIGTIPNPNVTWNGTPTTGANTYLFKVDSSETFSSVSVPEPEIIGLLGLGLLGLAPSSLRRRKLKASL